MMKDVNHQISKQVALTRRIPVRHAPIPHAGISQNGTGPHAERSAAKPAASLGTQTTSQPSTSPTAVSKAGAQSTAHTLPASLQPDGPRRASHGLQPVIVDFLLDSPFSPIVFTRHANRAGLRPGEAVGQMCVTSPRI
jgi:hypothetical protein